MKYWYFKGADVAGPLSVAEIVKDENFSADTFVCPEPESADSEAWKPADQYMQDFGYFLDPANYPNPPAPEEPEAKEAPVRNEAAKVSPASEGAPLANVEAEGAAKPIGEEQVLKPAEEEANNSADFEPSPVIEPAKPEQIVEPEHEELPSGEPSLARAEGPMPTEYNIYSDRVNPNDLPAEDDIPPEETIHARSPLNASMDNNLLDEIPASAVLSSEEEAAIEEVLAEPSYKEKGEEDEIVFNEDAAFHAEENSSPKQVFEAEKPEDTAPVLVPAREEKAEERAESPFENGKNPGRQMLEEARMQASLIEPEEKEEEDIFPPEKQEEPEESLDTFTASTPVMRIEPGQEPALKREETPLPEEKAEPNAEEARGEGKELPSGEEPPQEKKPAEKNEPEESTEDSSSNEDEIKPIFDSSEPLISREEAILSVDDEKEYGAHHTTNHGILAGSHEADAALLSVQESVNSQFVKAAPTTTGNIISSSDGRVQNPKNKRNDLIYVMVMFMFVLIVVALMMMFTSEKNKKSEEKQPRPSAQTVSSSALAMDEPVARSVIQGIDEGMPSPEAQPERETGKPQLPAAVKEAAADVKTQDPARYCETLVKNYRLSGGETIAQRFGRLYGDSYQTKWDCRPLYGDRYVGEFFASKVRSEPIRYMFSVDVKSGNINGMNNAAIELLIEE